MTTSTGWKPWKNWWKAKGTLSHDERIARRDAWDRAARATPHGEPIVLGREKQ